MKKRTKKGFTLIELIVVIAILAVLAVIAVPVVTGWVAEARDSAAEANARTIELAVKATMTSAGAMSTADIATASALSDFGITTPLGGTTDFNVNTDGSVDLVNNGTGQVTFD